MASNKTVHHKYRPGINQIRRHQAVRVKLKASSMVTPLAKGLKVIDGHHGADDRINGVLMIRNKLMGQKGKGLSGAIAQKT